MEVGGKILVGAAVTVVLALVGHAATGEQFIAGLEQKAETELTAMGLADAQVNFSRDPLSRSAILDGELTGDAKEKALLAVAAIPGVSDASWKGDGEAGKIANGGEAAERTQGSANATKIAECQTNVDKIIAARKINFRSGSAYVSPESNRILDEVAAALKVCGELSIAVEGHTDDNGDSGVNKAMSQERADRIKAGLVDRGMSERLISATGYGSTRPKARGSDAAADAQNRRIEFRIGTADTAPKSAPQNGAKAQQGE